MTTSAPTPQPATRATLVERATRQWTDHLVDLSGRNGLLFYRDLPVGTLDLTAAEATAKAKLLAGGKVGLSALYQMPDQLKDAAKRCRKIRDKAKENLEERGVDTLYLAQSMATWTPPPGSTATPAAPILLTRIHLQPMGAAAEDFELSTTAPAELNPTLFYALETEFGVKADLDAIRDLADGEDNDQPLDPALVAAEVSRLAANLAGFKVTDRQVLGNFSYLKLPMVVDLRANGAALEAHDLIAAIAGDAAAQTYVRSRRRAVDPTTLDEMPPAAEFLVLDADGSQEAAIETVIRGSDVVIQGPPGTGKSQTISNLIASATAKGMRVLFVAEKRAAIDAVVGRLNRVGLDDLVLDLHGGVPSRRKLAENLAAALASAKAALPPDTTALQNSLTLRRDLLTAHAKAVNEPRTPWSISLYQAQGRATAAADLATGIRLAPAVVDAIPGERLDALKEDLRGYLASGAAAMTLEANPWSGAAAVDEAGVETLSDATMNLTREALPNLRTTLASTAAEAGIPAPTGYVQAAALASALGARTRLAADIADGVYPRAAELTTALEPANKGFLARTIAGLFNGPYKAALAEAKSLAREAQQPPAQLAGLVAQAAAAQATWSEAAWETERAGTPIPATAGGTQLEQAAANATQLIGTIGAVLAPPQASSATIDQMAAWAATLEADLGTLRKLPDMRRRRASLLAAGIDQVAQVAVDRRLSIDDAVRALDAAWASAIVERVITRDPNVGGLDAARLNQEVADFIGLDRQHIGSDAARVKRAWAERAVAARDKFPDQDLTLSAEAKKKSRHLSVRELFTRAPDVLTAVKPCWAMSPLLVSQILPGDRQYFDLVVFDEASQILPADAIPSILRGKRAVVAGDDLQLPPTTFFASQTDRDDADAADGEGLMEGFTSILDIADSLIGSQPLRWHYRSRDERLIAFSNLNIYRPKFRSLTTFPAVVDDNAVRHVRVAPRLDRADGVSSAEEVSAVVGLILEHAATRPTESLGVIAMGISHAERISEALRLERVKRPELDAFFGEGGVEPFFVKNLERVQGDERDAIILTIGYGRTADGKLRQNFGPINQQGGERRLNVAITRAKRRIAVVSTFGSEDIDPSRSAGEGVRLLRAYLRYAESGGSDLGGVVDARPELNGFERSVSSFLAGAGIASVPQLGTSGYYLDFALAHPAKPGRFVLAVECDGAGYHSAPNARERDRLRQQQLEVMGWRFHRIWSTDWFRDPAREGARLVAAYTAAVASVDAALAAPPHPPPPPELLLPKDISPLALAVAHSPMEPVAPAVPRGPQPRIGSYESIDDVSPAKLDEIVRWIVSDKQLRTHGEIETEAIAVLGFKRKGPRITAAVDAAINRVLWGRR
jgi:very-short-patch-repair endonuclease